MKHKPTKEPDRREQTRIANRQKACMIEYENASICVDTSIPVLSIMGKKYTALIIGVIGNKGERKSFNEILKNIPFSSSTIISKRLKELKDYGIITGDQLQGGKSYSLTEFGFELRKSLLPFIKTVVKYEGTLISH